MRVWPLHFACVSLGGCRGRRHLDERMTAAAAPSASTSERSGASASVVASTPATAVVEGPVPLRAPDPSTIPTGPLGDSIRRGLLLVTRTFEELPAYAKNGLHCTSCHLEAGTRAYAAPWVGIVGMFPEYRARSATVQRLEERIGDCFARSLAGTPLPDGSPDLIAIVSYMTWLSRGIPVGREVEGRGFARTKSPPAADPVRGKTIYLGKCASCHGEDGAGRLGEGGVYAFPPLWGPRSFNIAAGMARLDTAAAFVRSNMPLGQGGTLSEQDAYDVAAYFTQQPRPDFDRKMQDWPKGGKPRDARY